MAGAQLPAPGERVCGDGFRIIASEGAVLVAVVDGLGHGPLAKEAADAFLLIVEEHPRLPLEEMMTAGGRAVASTRGVAATLARLGPGRIEHLGVGNVRVMARARHAFHAVPMPGIVGGRHRRPRLAVGRVEPGDLFFFCTDGISATEQLPADPLPATVSELALALLAGAKRQDDATVVVARAGA